MSYNPRNRKDERNCRLILYLCNGMRIIDAAIVEGIKPPRVEQIVKDTLKKFFPNDDHVKYLTAKGAVLEYKNELLNKQEISDMEEKLRNREFKVGEVVLYANIKHTIKLIEGNEIELDNGVGTKTNSYFLKKLEEVEPEIPKRKKNRFITGSDIILV